MSRKLFDRKIAGLFFITFAAHGMMFLMDGIYWDDYLLFDHDSNKVAIWLQELGIVGAVPAFFHWGIKQLFGTSFIFGYRLMAFLCICGTGLIVFQLLQVFKKFNQTNNFLVAAFVATYPAVKVLFIGGILHYQYCLLSYLLAVYIAFTKVFDDSAGRTLSRLWWRLGSLLLCVVSFTMNSILSFYFGFIILMFLFNKDEGPVLKRIRRFMMKKGDYLALPFVFFITEKIFFPARGIYEGYNGISFGALTRIFELLLINIYWFTKPLFGLARRATLLLTAFFLLYVLVLIGVRFKQWIRLKKLPQDYGPLFFSLFLMFLGALPYAAVGKAADSSYASRHLLLAGISTGLLLMSVADLSVGLKIISSKVKNIIFAAVIALFCFVDMGNYIHWQFRWIRDRSVILQLAENPELKKYSTFLIEDKACCQNEKNIYYDYRFYEWASLFKMVWHGEKWVGYSLESPSPEQMRDKRYLTARYNLAEYNPKGRKAVLSLRGAGGDGCFGNAAKVLKVFEYFYIKFFDRVRMDSFLNGIVQIKISPV
ncbi:MAG: hypothetical protein PHN49_00045 [Candidatus Omnitrophica bacterium]|nr:hypothetical protein [Candidatus Omnitrophota bacterium]